MRFFSILIPIVGIMFMASSCKQESSNEQVKDEVSSPEFRYGAMEAIPIPDLQFLADNSTFGDLIFTKLGMSMGLNNRASVINSLKYIQPASSAPPHNCTPDARIIYSSDEGILREADLYASEGCSFVVFLEKGLPVSGSILTATGLEFYGNLIAQYEQARRDAINNQ